MSMAENFTKASRFDYGCKLRDLQWGSQRQKRELLLTSHRSRNLVETANDGMALITRMSLSNSLLHRFIVGIGQGLLLDFSTAEVGASMQDYMTFYLSSLLVITWGVAHAFNDENASIVIDDTQCSNNADGKSSF